MIPIIMIVDLTCVFCLCNCIPHIIVTINSAISYKRIFLILIKIYVPTSVNYYLLNLVLKHNIFTENFNNRHFRFSNVAH